MIDVDRSSKIIRIQADKLCEQLGLPKNTYLELSELQLLANSSPMKSIEFRGKSLEITFSIHTNAQLILDKISSTKDT